MANTRAARNRSPQGAILSPDPVFEMDDPEDRLRSSSSFALQAIMDLQKSNGTLAQSIADLAKTIDLKTQKLDRIDDLRVDLKECSTKLEAVRIDLKEIKGKTERIHTWVVGAAAIVGAVIVISQIGLRFIPSGAPTPIVVQMSPATQPAAPSPK